MDCIREYDRSREIRQGFLDKCLSFCESLRFSPSTIVNLQICNLHILPSLKILLTSISCYRHEDSPSLVLSGPGPSLNSKNGRAQRPLIPSDRLACVCAAHEERKRRNCENEESTPHRARRRIYLPLRRARSPRR